VSYVDFLEQKARRVPTAGIGSEGVESVKRDRRFLGIELKRSYFETACRNLEAASSQLTMETAA